MANAYLRYNFSGIANDVIMVWYEHSNPTAEIDRWLLDGSTDHEKDGAHIATGLNPVLHQFRFYESSDGSTLETLRLTISVDAGLSGQEAQIEIFEYVVDRGNDTDPVSGSIELRDANLLNENYWVDQRGLGRLLASEITDRSDDGGGFDLNSGATFNTGDSFFVTIYRSVSVQQSTSAQAVSDIVVATADFTINSSYYDKMIIANFAGTVGTITFPALNTLANLKSFTFNTHGGSQNYLALQFDASDSIRFNGEDKNVVYIPKNHVFKMIVKDGNAYVLPGGSYDESNRGAVKIDYADRVSTGPFLLAHEDTGELDADDYPGLYEWVEGLPPGVACALSDWNDIDSVGGRTVYVNRRRYGINTITRKFRVPDLRDMHIRFLKADVSADTERVNDVPGGYQSDGIRPADGVGGLKVTGTFTFLTGDNSIDEPNLVTLHNISPIVASTTRGENYGQIPLIYL